MNTCEHCGSHEHLDQDCPLKGVYFGRENPQTHYMPPATLKDSGQREEMPTGSRRDTRVGKGRYDLLPTRALRRLARHFEAGAIKYGDRNWEKGQPLSRFMDSALRHALSFLEGQRDEDHLAAAIWNLICLC